MTVAYVTFPGTSGNYVDTENENLLTSDQAHAHQAHAISGGNFTPSVDDAPGTPPFGTKASRLDLAHTATNQAIRVADGTAGVATSPSDVRSLSLFWYTSEAGLQAKATILWNNAAGNTLAGGDGSYTNLTQNAWTEVVVENQTAVALTAFTGIQTDIKVAAGGNVPLGTYWLAARCIRAGTDSTFIPSVRIVGDLDMRARFAATTATPAAAKALIGQRSGNSGYAMTLGTGGELVVYHGTGSGTRAETSSGLALVAATDTVVRSVIDISAGTWTHYKNGVQFDTSGSFATTAGSPFTGPLAVGADSAGTSGNWAGDLYYAEVRDGIDGPVVRRFDADDLIGLV